MKKLIALLAFAMPFTIFGQTYVDTYSPTFTSQTSAILHSHVIDPEDFAEGDTATLVFRYNQIGYPVIELDPIYVTNEFGTHFEAPVFGLIPGTDYENNACLYLDGVEISCGPVEVFITDDIEYTTPEVETSGAYMATSLSVSLSGYIEEYGGFAEIDGFAKLGEDPYIPEITTSSISVSEPYGDFAIDLNKLKSEKLFHFWMCGENAIGDECGERGFFNTTSPGPVDVYIYDYEQVGTCSMEIEFGAFAGDRPSQMKGELRVGNPGGEAFYTFLFYYDNEMDGSGTLLIDYAPIVLAGVDLHPNTTVFSIRMDSYGVLGKVSGKLPFDGDVCNDEFEFIGEGDVARTAGESVVRVYPNPTPNKIFLQNSTGGKATIADLFGKTIESYQIEPGVTEISLNHLPAGAYMVIFMTEDGKRFSDKIIKQ